MKKLFSLILLILCIATRYALPQNLDAAGLNTPLSKTPGEIVIRGLAASGEAQLINAVVMSYNVGHFIITGLDSWAIPSSDSIYRNLTEPWEWEDTDGFKVNQMGHPIHGSVYFNAGRLNGFNFYESVFFSAFGSSSWEVFGERNTASINDFLTTVSCSMPLGEMFYRLYLEAYSGDFPMFLAICVNPMAGFHRLVTGSNPPHGGGNLYLFQTYAGTSYAQAHSAISDSYGSKEMFSFRGPVADMGLSMIYGDPFVQESRVPFSHFEFDLSVGIDLGNYLGIRFNSDGYLFSVSPFETDMDMLTTGLSMSLDTVSAGKWDIDESSTINLFSNALAWSVKYQHFFSQNLTLQTRFLFGFTYLGVSEYYSPIEGRDLHNYGAGPNCKFSLNLEHKRLGKLQMSVFGYLLWTYPGTSAVQEGTASWLFTDITYSHSIMKNWSLGIGNSFAAEHGLYGDFPDIRRYTNVTRIFLAYNK